MKRGVWVSVLLLLLLGMLPLVHSIGLIYPRSYFKLIIPYEPGGEYTLSFKVRANAGRTMNFNLWAEGEFADYVTFNPPLLENVPDGALPSFSATINFPQSFSTPGPHTLKIYAGETSSQPGGVLSIKTNIHHVVTIMVPYPYLYADMSFLAENVNENEPVRFPAHVRNLGENDISSAMVTVTVYDSDYSIVGSVKSDLRSIASQQSEDFDIIWVAAGIKPGEYTASARLSYDGESATADTTFKIGTLSVMVKDYTKEFYPDTINRFEIVASSLWNSPLSSVFAEVSIPGQPLLQTPTVRMEPFADTTLIAFWDTTDVVTGQYEGTIDMYFDGTKSSYPILVELLELPEQAEPEKVAEDVGEPSGFRALLKLSNLLIVIIVLLILTDLIWMFRRKRS